MRTWLDYYHEGRRMQAWTEMAGVGALIRRDELLDDAVAVARETMKHARTNVERLVEALPQLGYVFEESALGSPLTPATDSTPDDLDALERDIGTLPLALRIWFEEVGQVNLMGDHPDWACTYLEPARRRGAGGLHPLRVRGMGARPRDRMGPRAGVPSPYRSRLPA
jgi:hypothetical protein